MSRSQCVSRGGAAEGDGDGAKESGQRDVVSDRQVPATDTERHHPCRLPRPEEGKEKEKRKYYLPLILLFLYVLLFLLHHVKYLDYYYFAFYSK